MMKVVTLPGKLESLDQIRAWVREWAREAGMDEDRAYQLCLAVDEIATNVVLYGYEEAGRSGPLSLWPEPGSDSFSVVLEDQGRPYDPHGRHLPDPQELRQPLDERSEGGLGIFLALGAVDDLQYESQGGRNRHRFVMRL